MIQCNPVSPGRIFSLLFLFSFLGAGSLVTAGGSGEAGSEDPAFNRIAPSSSPEALFDPDGIRLAPYLLRLGEHRVRLAWREPEERVGKARLEGREYQRTVNTGAGYQHVVEFKDLTPDTRYTCSVLGFEPFSFSTLASTSERRFTILGHTGGVQRMDSYPDELTVARILDFDPDFTLHAGDCVDFSQPSDWRHLFFDLFRKHLRRVPVFVSPGNHDSGAPFLDGYDLRCFKEVLPYGFPRESQTGPSQAFYHVRQGAVDLYFLSYVADMTADSVQMSWLRRELDKSEAAFRIVVYGGTNKYYNKPETLALLGAMPIDLVVNGDGGQSREWLNKSGPVPVLHAGSNAGGIRTWLACEANESWLTIRKMEANGTQLDTGWIHRKRLEVPIFHLAEPKATVSSFWSNYSYSSAEPWRTEHVSGIQLRVSGLADGKALCSVLLQPTGPAQGPHRGYALKIAHFSNQDSLLTFAFPATRPMGSGILEFDHIHLRFVDLPAGSELKVEEAWLY